METEVAVDGGNSSTPNAPLQGEANISGNGRMRLTGAARKRFKKLVTTAGVAVEEALHLCRKPWREIPADKQRPTEALKRRLDDKTLKEPANKTLKLIPEPSDSTCNQKPGTFNRISEATSARIRNFQSMPEEQMSLVHRRSEGKTSKQPENKPPTLIPVPTCNQNPRIFKRIAEATRVGICNSQPMTEEQMSLVHRHLILSIAKMDTVGDGPEFLGFSQKSGWILVTCVNQRSRDWLVEEISNLKPWPKAQLTAVSEHELPRSTTVVTFIPKSEAASIAEAMTLLKVQNKGLKPGLWRVLYEKEEEMGRVVTFAIDDNSLQALKARDYVAILGFRRIFFKNRKEQQASEQPVSNSNAHSNSEPTPSTSGRQITEGSQIQRKRSFIFRGRSTRGSMVRTMIYQKLNPNLRDRYTPQTGEAKGGIDLSQW